MKISKILFFLSIPSIIYAEESKAIAQEASKIYQMDLFSLISFGLAITALIVSLFMSWLSWEFYKKSTETSENTNKTVAKIEASIVAIQNSISEIVQRAVGYWVEGGGEDSKVTGIKDELYEKFGELEEKLNASNGGNTPEISNEIAELKEQINELSLGVRKAQVRSLFPGILDESPAIEHNQIITSTEENKQQGQITIILNKSIPYATATGKFKPRMSQVPDLAVNLIGSPYDNNDDVKFSKGVGTPKDFNIHLNGKGTPLKVGNYIFNYVATVNQEG